MDINTIFKRNRLGLIILLALLVAIPLTIYLVRQQQILKGRAAHAPPIEIITSPDVDNSVYPPRSSSRNIRLRLNYEP
ncbi:MAG: hypothetical protein CEO21_177 [Microgenomates group bacterium Gr01-1014_80]|nr:MAG: hypothetical protein CEO21_177 [Microgenomates group bacterium Gr01-1014_80]